MLYLRMCLAYSAGTTPLSKNLVDMQDDAPAIGRYIHTLLASDPQPLGSKGAESNPVHVYIDLLQQLLSAIGGEETSGFMFALHYFLLFVFFLHFESYLHVMRPQGFQLCTVFWKWSLCVQRSWRQYLLKKLTGLK